MEIVIKTPDDGEEEQIIIKCRNFDEDLLKLIYQIKTRQEMLVAYDKDQEKTYCIHPVDVFYFEAVEKHTFLYTKNQVLTMKQKLYQIEEVFMNSNFVRVSKSVILNIIKINNIYPTFSGRFEALLDNGEKISISRQYVPNLKKKMNEWEG